MWLIYLLIDTLLILFRYPKRLCRELDQRRSVDYSKYYDSVIAIFCNIFYSRAYNYAGGKSMDGLYKINLKTKMGDLEGLIYILTKDNNLSGYIEIMGNKTEFSGGKVEGNNLFIKGKARAGIITIKYEIYGEVKQDTLIIKANTNMGSFETIGKKI